MRIIDSDLLSVQEARILAENACEAQKMMQGFSQERLDKIVECIASELDKYAEELARMSQDETGYGKWQDKYVKNRFVCNYLRRQLRGMRCVGVIKEDQEKRIIDVGVPVGVIVALCPATSPVSTTIYKTLIAVKSGNAIIFSPHSRAKEVTSKVLDIIIKTSETCGLPEGTISYLHTLTHAGISELIHHDYTSVVLNTGVPEALKLSAKSGKPVIYGGSGNGPAFIERTANIEQSVSDIIYSKTFDNGIVSAAEHSVVVDTCVADQVKEEFIKNGAYFMTTEESDKLGRMFFRDDGTMSTEIIGVSAFKLAANAGFSIPSNTTVLISPQKYVFNDNPYSREKLCPVLAYYIEDDWQHACEKCIELLLGERQGHTLVIHSEDEDVIRQFALKKPVARLLVNTPAVFGGMGITTNLFPAMTLGSGFWGCGITSDNVSPMNLIYIRKVGYGVKRISENFKNLWL